MDNLKAHKVAGIREANEAAQATLRYLPRYSPDLSIWGPTSELRGPILGHPGLHHAHYPGPFHRHRAVDADHRVAEAFHFRRLRAGSVIFS